MQAAPSHGACLRVAQDGPVWAAARPPVLPALPGGWGPSEAEVGCLTQAHTVTQGLVPGGVLGPGQVNHHGRSRRGAGAVLQWAVCVFVSVCACVWGWSPVRARFPTPSPTLLASPSLPLPGPADSLPRPGLGPSTPRPPAVDGARNCAAFVPWACAFKRFHAAPLVSITHGALQAFRCQKQDLKPAGRQVSAHPSSLPSAGGRLPKS